MTNAEVIEPDEPDIPDTDDDEGEDEQERQANGQAPTPAQAIDDPEETHLGAQTPGGVIGFLEAVWAEIEKIGHIGNNLKTEAGVARNQSGTVGNAHSDELARLGNELIEAHQNLRGMADQALGTAPSTPVSATGTDSGAVPSASGPAGDEAAGPGETNKA